MIFIIIYFIHIYNDINININRILLLGFICYFILFQLEIEIFKFYGNLIIPLDLFLLNDYKNNNKLIYKNKIKELVKIIKIVINTKNNTLKNNNNNYLQKDIKINDIFKHTLNNIFI